MGQTPKAAEQVRETELYPPIKTFLEDQGWEVKAEVGAADVVACRDGDAPLIVELKTGFSLTLVHQAVARQSITDTVYIAVPRKTGRANWTTLKNMRTLCRRLGLGLITVRMKDAHIEVHCDPGPYRPRQSKVRSDRMLREFAKRSGDPNVGGSMRTGLVTAYRQDALRCATLLANDGPAKGADVAKTTGVAGATRLMAANHYGWFRRVERGIYDLTETGRAAPSEAGEVA